MSVSRRVVGVVALTALAASLAACVSHVTYVDDAEPRALVEVETFAAEYATTDWARTSSDGAQQLRSEALADLRGRGGEAAALADLLTAGFSASRGVPVYVEATAVDGSPAWILIEVYGPDGGTLDRRRLWVLSRPDGAILSSATYR